MFEKAKKILKKVVKFALGVCTLLGGVILVCGLPFDEIKEKLGKKKEQMQAYNLCKNINVIQSLKRTLDDIFDFMGSGFRKNKNFKVSKVTEHKKNKNRG